MPISFERLEDRLLMAADCPCNYAAMNGPPMEPIYNYDAMNGPPMEPIYNMGPELPEDWTPPEPAEPVDPQTCPAEPLTAEVVVTMLPEDVALLQLVDDDAQVCHLRWEQSISTQELEQWAADTLGAPVKVVDLVFTQAPGPETLQGCDLELLGDLWIDEFLFSLEVL